MSFEVKNEKIEKTLKEIGRLIKKALPSGWGFTLLMFDFSKGKKGSMFYLSDAKREDMIEAMEEFIKKQRMN